MNTSNKKNSTLSSTEKFGQAYELASEAASELVDTAKMKAKNKVEDGKDYANQASDFATTQASDATKKAENLIKERPLLSIGCAFAAGWLVSKIMK